MADHRSEWMNNELLNIPPAQGWPAHTSSGVSCSTPGCSTLKKPDKLSSSSSSRSPGHRDLHPSCLGRLRAEVASPVLPEPPSSRSLSQQVDNCWHLLGFSCSWFCCCLLVLPCSQAGRGQATVTSHCTMSGPLCPGSVLVLLTSCLILSPVSTWSSCPVSCSCDWIDLILNPQRPSVCLLLLARSPAPVH